MHSMRPGLHLNLGQGPYGEGEGEKDDQGWLVPSPFDLPGDGQGNGRHEDSIVRKYHQLQEILPDEEM